MSAVPPRVRPAWRSTRCRTLEPARRVPSQRPAAVPSAGPRSRTLWATVDRKVVDRTDRIAPASPELVPRLGIDDLRSSTRREDHRADEADGPPHAALRDQWPPAACRIQSDADERG